MPAFLVAVALATAVAAPARAGAHPAALTVKLHYEMVCGQPGPGPAVLTLPRAMRVPAVVPASAVLVQGRPAGSVAVSGHVLRVALPRPPQVTCMSIGPGTLTIVLTRRAGLRNPLLPGSYAVLARTPKGGEFTAPLAIR